MSPPLSEQQGLKIILNEIENDAWRFVRNNGLPGIDRPFPEPNAALPPNQ